MTEQQPGEVLGYSIGEALSKLGSELTQIPLDPNVSLIPYGDLKATGAYGRGLIVPDDIPPVMSHIILTGSKNGAKLGTGANVDGAQDVYVVNQSGGGGGGGSGLAPSKYGNKYEINPLGAASGGANGQARFELEYQTGSYFGFLFDLTFQSFTSGPGHIDFYLQSKSLQDLQVAIASFHYPVSPAAGLTADASVRMFIPLSPPLSLPLTFAGDPQDIWMYQDTNGIGYVGTCTAYSSGGT